MSAEPQPPIKRFLDVPDVVGAVFEHLDPASRRAFFESHPHVAHAGPVLAQSELCIELSPTDSLEDQWQRVLWLTRSQPLRCLHLAGPSRERLLDFLQCTLDDRHGEKQVLLHGTKDVRFQVVIKLETGDMSHLLSHLSSWREEQQGGVQGMAVQLVLDLCGRELPAMTEGNLEPPNNCTLRNGSLQLLGSSMVMVAANRSVRFKQLTIASACEQPMLVEVVDGGSLEMEGCHVEGGSTLADTNGAAVRVQGSSSSRPSSLHCHQTTLHSSEGFGLLVEQGGVATLEQCSVSDCYDQGVIVIGKGSSLHAANCNVDRNGWDNFLVCDGAHASLEHVTSNGSQRGRAGWRVADQGSLKAVCSEANGNMEAGAWVEGDGSIMLVRCQCNDNAHHGLVSYISGSIVAEDCLAKGNRFGNVQQGTNVTCHGKCDFGRRWRGRECR